MSATESPARDETDRDMLILMELKKKADAMTEAEFQAELRENEIRVFESCTKYDSNE